MRVPRALVATMLSLSVLTGGIQSAAADEPRQTGQATPALESQANQPLAANDGLLLTLDRALNLAESRNPGLRLAAMQLINSRGALDPSPATSTALAPVASAFIQAQYGITIPAQAISPGATAEQARFIYEQTAAQYYAARQQVRAGTLRAYVEWQRAVAMVASQQAALERTLTQEANVRAALAVGSAAQYDLLQIQAGVAGQQAGLIGAQAMESAARSALGQVIGTPLAPAAYPEPNTIRAADVTLPTNLEALVARALTNHPDLRGANLDLASRRRQAELAVGGVGTIPQLQATATQFELAALEARAKITQALLASQGALEELRAREIALAPAREALRLAELRHEAGLATWVEVQAASAAALEVEVGRIQAASNLLIRLLELRQATGDL